MEKIENLLKTKPTFDEFGILCYLLYLSWQSQDSIITLKNPLPGFRLSSERTRKAIDSLQEKGFIKIVKDGTRFVDKYLTVELLDSSPSFLEETPLEEIPLEKWGTKEIVRFYAQKYLEVFGTKYLMDEKRDCVFVSKKLRAEFGLEIKEIHDMIKVLFDSWHGILPNHSPAGSISCLGLSWVANRLLMEAKKEYKISEIWESPSVLVERGLNEFRPIA